jgi:adenylate cyclase
MIVAGEIGDLKQEIAFVGDPMNAASRMERICKERNRSLVLSGETLWRLTVPREFEVEPLGRLTFRGSEQELELFAVSRVGRALTARQEVK